MDLNRSLQEWEASVLASIPMQTLLHPLALSFFWLRQTLSLRFIY